MSESNATGADPRYDPRFQRGYSGGEETDAPGPPSRQSSLSHPQRESLQELERRASERTAPKRAPEPASPLIEQPIARDSVESTARSRDAVDPAAGVPAAGVPAAAVPAAGDPDQPIEAAARGTRWFWIAIGVCLAFIVVGGFVYWTQASDPGIYGAPRSTIDETTRMFLSTMSVTLVQSGVIGAVAVLVVWATRSARAGRGSR